MSNLSDNEKDKNKKQGFLETVKKVNEAERRKAEEAQAREQKKQEIKREKYNRTLAEERVELLKLRQGVIKESDKLDLSPDEEKEYTRWQKFKNFIFHNKWWLGIASFFVLVASFLIYDTLTSTDPDIYVMQLVNDTAIYAQHPQLCDYLETHTKDYNEDGEIYTNVFYIPISGEAKDDVGMYETSLTKLSGEFQLGQTMLVIADEKIEDIVGPEERFENLEEIFPDNPHVKGYGFYLKGTGFAEKIGLTDDDISEEMYISVRKVTNTLHSEEETKENHDKAMEMLKSIINELS